MPGLECVIDIDNLFDGFSSNAVVAIMAATIIGAGLDKTDLMTRVAGWIVRLGGSSERGVTFLIAACAALASVFVQNIGTAAPQQ